MMDREKIEYYDIIALLRQDELSLRNLAEISMMTISEFFSLLSDFLAIAPNAERALSQFISRNADKESYRGVNEMAALLKKLGCEKIISAFYSILGAYEQGNWRLASQHAESISGSFRDLYAGISGAKRTEETVHSSNLDATLKRYIKFLDEKEEERKLVILAIDDSPVLLKSVSAVLGAEYKVYTLPKPTELHKILQQITPDLFLLDYMMPEVNGFELVTAIRSYEEHKDTPVIFLTSIGTVDNVTAAIALGASDFIVKPFNPESLREKVARHIVRKKSF